MFAIFACGSLDILQQLTVLLCGYSIKPFKTEQRKADSMYAPLFWLEPANRPSRN